MKHRLRMIRAARAHARGFTLSELMVSLVAGLIVTLAVVGLARTATTTFHEQVRSTATEMSLRLAGQRLTGDLSRAGYMSTGNIRWDPQIARLRTAPLPATGSRYANLNDLAAIRIYQAGTPEAGTLPRDSDNGLFPEAIDITGNFTSNDQYLGVISTDPPLPGVVCPAQAMTLNNDDPAVMRIMRQLMPDRTTPARADADAQILLRSIFIPVAGRPFAARVGDPSGKTHFVMVADATVVGGIATISFAAPTGGCPVLTGEQTGQKGGFDGYEQLQIAPIQTVRWNLRRLPNARLDPVEDPDIKYDLVRQFVDASGLLVGNPEIVSEYAVDLKFAFNVDQSPTAPTSLSFDFEDVVNNQNWSTTGVNAAPRVLASDPAPHRIRSVRFRLADRTALSDRKFDLPGPAAGFIHRYCLDGVPSATCVRYARVRTLMSEVALMNQARATY